MTVVGAFCSHEMRFAQVTPGHDPTLLQWRPLSALRRAGRLSDHLLAEAIPPTMVATQGITGGVPPRSELTYFTKST